MLKGRAAIQRDPDRLDEQVNSKLMKFNKELNKSCPLE